MAIEQNLGKKTMTFREHLKRHLETFENHNYVTIRSDTGE